MRRLFERFWGVFFGSVVDAFVGVMDCFFTVAAAALMSRLVVLFGG